MFRFNIGDKVMVKDDTSSHHYKMGESVTILEQHLEDDDNPYYEVRNDNGTERCAYEDDLTLIENGFIGYFKPTAHIYIEDLMWQSSWEGHEVGFDDIDSVELYQLKNTDIHFYIEVPTGRILTAWSPDNEI